MAHAPILQVAMACWSMAQTLPPEPQLFESLNESVSQPFAGLPSQLRKPMLQAARAHMPPTHVADALGIAHTLPQAPQFCVSLPSIASQPFIASLSQSANPMRQAPTP